jgi:hypothetical protein
MRSRQERGYNRNCQLDIVANDFLAWFIFSIVNPCASIIASVQPSEDATSNSRARRLLVHPTYTTRKRRLSSITRAPCRRVAEMPGGERRVLINRD